MNIRPFKLSLLPKDIRQFHIVTNRPWPIMLSLLVIIVITNGIDITIASLITKRRGWVQVSIIFIITITFMWWRDVSRERNSGQHGKSTTNSIQIRIILFITSEVCFFFGFFWSFFWAAFEYKIATGLKWPPSGVIAFNPYSIPLLNSRILLASGVTVTWSHKILYDTEHNEAVIGLITTIILGAIFTFFQYYEYKNRFFSISDSMYGALFFIMTGLLCAISRVFLCSIKSEVSVL